MRPWIRGLVKAASATAAAMFLAATGASAQDDEPAAGRREPSAEQADGVREAGRRAGHVVTQPVRDVGISKTDIPPVLQNAVADPYSVRTVRTCRQLGLAIADLNEALGPDFVAGDQKKENKAARLAEAGGKTVVNSLIPFRVLVREISGAAPAQRRRDEAIAAGYARRGFLRGLYLSRGCRPVL